ncbi:MAG TPA: type II toxin-antitoxin system death-on-curing family toxin [Blastocatellia bacterium]|nr:type II toxin-antitoxin system death-on-curing family toxin [Blastocatellia bacterium]
METDPVYYFSYVEAVALHIFLMREYGELRFGVADRTLVESALARPQQAAAYENAELIRQAATLCFGLIKNHPWFGGNKRTATAITQAFLKKNKLIYHAHVGETLQMVLNVESDLWKVDEIEVWLRARTHPFKK